MKKKWKRRFKAVLEEILEEVEENNHPTFLVNTNWRKQTMNSYFYVYHFVPMEFTRKVFDPARLRQLMVEETYTLHLNQKDLFIALLLTKLQ